MVGIEHFNYCLVSAVSEAAFIMIYELTCLQNANVDLNILDIKIPLQENKLIKIGWLISKRKNTMFQVKLAEHLAHPEGIKLVIQYTMSRRRIIYQEDTMV